MSKRRSIITAILALSMLVLAACSGNNQSSTNQAISPTAEPDKLKVQLSWVHTIEFAGFHLAQENGYYKDENLDVELMSGGFDPDGNYIDPPTNVADGKADIGVIGIDRVLQARADDLPLVAVSSIYQRSAGAILSLAESNIQKPEDLIGKKVALAGGPTTTYFYAMLKQVGIDPDQIDIVERTDFSTAPLTSGEFDAMDSFITNEPILLEQSGQKGNTILFSDYGLDAYSNLIFTTEDMVKNKADVVERFLRATLRGYQASLDDPEKAAELSVKYNPELSQEAELASMKASIPLLLPAANKHLGDMQATVFDLVYKLLRENNTLTQDTDIQKAFTMQFLDKLYGDAKS